MESKLITFEEHAHYLCMQLHGVPVVHREEFIRLDAIIKGLGNVPINYDYAESKR